MKTALAFVLLTSILLRFWFALGYWAEKPLTHDSNEYLELAQSFNKTGTFTYSEKHTQQIESYGRAPGYPFWLAMLMRISPTVAWIRLAESIISILITFLFFLIAKELFGMREGITAFIISSFYIPFIALGPVVLSENLWIFLLLLSYWLLLRSQNPEIPRSPVAFAAAFVLLGLATLIRPAALFLLPLYAFWIYRQSNWRSAAVHVLLYVLILLPWQIHLYKKEGRFIFVATEGGVTLWTGTHPQYSGDGDLAANPPVQKEYRALLKKYSPLSAADRDAIYRMLALDNVWNHPLKYFLIELKKLLFWIVPAGASVMQMSNLHKLASFLFYIPLLILAIRGFRELPAPLQIFFGGIAVSFTLMILIFFPQERFRISTLDPVFLLIASNKLVQR